MICGRSRGNSYISVIDPDPDHVWEDVGGRSIALFCKILPVRVDARLVEELKQLAHARGDRNIRLCLHDSPEAAHHDMIILEHKGEASRPHKHEQNGETYHVIEGELGIVTFDVSGNIIETCVLERGDMYRIGTDMYHAVVPLSEQIIFHETKPGPFIRPGDNHFPDWAPDGQDQAEAQAFTRRLEQALTK